MAEIRKRLSKDMGYLEEQGKYGRNNADKLKLHFEGEISRVSLTSMLPDTTVFVWTPDREAYNAWDGKEVKDDRCKMKEYEVNGHKFIIYLTLRTY